MGGGAVQTEGYVDRDGHNFWDPKIGEKCILDLSLVLIHN